MSDHGLAPPATQDPRSFCGPLYQAGELACDDFDQCFYDGRHCLKTTEGMLKYKRELRQAQAREGTLRRNLADANNSKAEQALRCSRAIDELAETKAALGSSIIELAEVRALLAAETAELAEFKAARPAKRRCSARTRAATSTATGCT